MPPHPAAAGAAVLSQRPLIARPTLFEHGMLPIPSTMPTIEQLCSMVTRVGGEGGGARAGRLSIASWHKIAKETFKMDTGYAQLVFEIFFDAQEEEVPEGGAEEINATEFALYLFILSTYKDEALMGGTPRALRADIAYPNLLMQGEQKEPLSPRSQPLSPRTVAAGTKAMDMERRQVTFLNKHVGELLAIVAGSAAASRVSPGQFDCLGCLMMETPIRGGDAGRGGRQRISMMVQSWRGGATFPLASKDLATWVTDSLSSPDQMQRAPSGGASPPKHFPFGCESLPTPMMVDGAGHSTDRQGQYVVSNLHKTTIIRSAGELVGSNCHPDDAPAETIRKDMRVQHCNESFVYITAPLRRVVVTGCNNCTVFVAACAFLTIENCERLKMIAGCRRVRVANSVDSTLHMLTVRQPLMLGENHDLVLAPFNALSSDCLRWWPLLRIDRSKNRWSEPLSLTKGPYGVALSGGAVAGQTLMSPESFFCATIPSNSPQPASVVASQANPCPLPPAFAAALQKKHKQVLDLRKDISETETTSVAPKAALQKAIQAKFKEWLVASGNLRQVQDLVQLDSMNADLAQTGGGGRHWMSDSA